MLHSECLWVSYCVGRPWLAQPRAESSKPGLRTHQRLEQSRLWHRMYVSRLDLNGASALRLLTRISPSFLCYPISQLRAPISLRSTKVCVRATLRLPNWVLMEVRGQST